MTSVSRAIELEKYRAYIAGGMRRRADRWVNSGYAQPQDLLRFKALVDCAETGVRILFTRDIGMHSSGWMKNPDYERCFHLSLSPGLNMRKEAPAAGIIVPDHDADNERAWVQAFFPGDLQRYLWMESPFSAMGKQHQVKHWRLFADAAWRPLLPRGEVYSKEFTELGWKSWSEVPGRVVISTVDPS